MASLQSLSTFLNVHLASSPLSAEQQADIGRLLDDMSAACIAIAQAIENGALEGNMGSLESENVQGEVQKALDVITHDIFVEHVTKSGLVSAMVSEEVEEYLPVSRKPTKKSTKNAAKDNGYLVFFDPLDGSSNVNVNISVGTIFSILTSPNAAPNLADILIPGQAQLCAGYAMYGSSTIFVLTVGNGSHGFTLNRADNTFYLTHPNMQIPTDTKEFAVNMSNYRFWQEPMQRYIDECLQGENGPREKDFNMRWVASMVAEVHRILQRGGVFMYPIDEKIQKKGGKLRLLYEANPMSFIVEQAGGGAVNGKTRIMELKPTGIHQRVPVLLGSKNEIDRLQQYHDGKRKK